MIIYKVGVVSHYYDRIGVAVIELQGDLAVGERIRFIRGGEDLFEQVVESIQYEHEKIIAAKSGDIVGIKIRGEVRPGADVYKLVEE